MSQVSTEEPLLVAVREAIRDLTGFDGCEIADTPAEVDAANVDAGGDFLYAIIYPIGWDYFGPSHADAPVAFQVTTVAASGRQALFNAGRVRRLLVEMSPATGDYVTPFAIPGLAIMGRACTTGGLDPEASTHSAVDRYVFWVTPVMP
ncbi:MAG: hypothetical protein LC798_16795 [Chloroflexi bacterium]|nr:hypothetical protein [Chloroflexota bacterium]